MTIREEIARFLRRTSDTLLIGRNAARIVVGTDRKDTPESGFGAGSENASAGASAIDIVAGYGEENPNFDEDRSRIYLSAKSNPDEYVEMELGEDQEETPSIILRTDQLYIKVRQFIKIRNEKVTILITPDGDVQIEAEKDTTIKSGDSVISMKQNGDISIGAESGIGRRIITEGDVCTGTDPTTGAFIQSRFVLPGVVGTDHPGGGFVNNSNVKIK